MDDERAEYLVGQYADLLLRIGLTWLGDLDDAKDICQTVLLKLLTGDEQFDSPEHEKAWVIRATANACKDELRSFRRRAVPLEEAAQAPAPEPPRSDVLDAVMALPPKYRAAVYLYYYEGYSVKEAGELLGAKASTVQTWLMRARGQLKTKLKEAEA